MQETPYPTIESTWEDTDLEQLSISANNGQFARTAQVYFGQGDVQLFGKLPPRVSKDNLQQQTFSGGNEANPPFAELVFRCADGTGHATVHVALAEIVYHNGLPFTENRVELELPFEPNALDDFCRELDLVARRTTDALFCVGCHITNRCTPTASSGMRAEDM